MAYKESPHYPNVAAKEQRAMIDVVNIYADELTEAIQTAYTEGHFFRHQLIGVPLVPQDASKAGPVPHVWGVNFRLVDDVMSLQVSRYAGWPDNTGTLHSLRLTDNSRREAVVNRFGLLTGLPPVTLITPIDTVFAHKTPEADLLANRPRVSAHIDGVIAQLSKKILK